MLGLAISLGIIGLDYAYHRLTKPPASKLAGATIEIPRTDLGGPVPLVFGWTKVKAPFLAFNATSTKINTDGDGNEVFRAYGASMLFRVGIPMGKGVTRGNRLAGPRLTRIWYGDYELPCSGFPVGTLEAQNVVRESQLGGPGFGGGLIGMYQWFGGWTDQRFDFPASQIGDALNTYTSSAGKYGGLPNQMCVALGRHIAPGDDYEPITAADPLGGTFVTTLPDTGFYFGESPSIQGISVEVQTYGDRVNDVTHQHIFAMKNEGTDFGGDADPMEVLRDLVTNDVLGKLGLPEDLIDHDTWGAASTTLKQEGHGYSRAFEEAQPASAIIQDIVRQVDGVFDIDITTGLLQFFLIRGDYDPATVPELNRTNTIRLESLRITAPTSVPNKVIVTYPDRSQNYAVLPAEAHNLANCVGQDGIVTPMSLHFEGVKNKDVALQIAERELAQVSRSLITCTAYVDGRFRYLHRGSVVKLTWQKPGISGRFFRVADIDRGTLANGTIRLDLIEDAYAVYRGQPPQDTSFGGHTVDTSGLVSAG